MDNRPIDTYPNSANALTQSYFVGQPTRMEDLQQNENFTRLRAAEIKFAGEKLSRLVYITDLYAENGPGDKYTAVEVG